MIWAHSQRGTMCLIVYISSYATRANGIIVLLNIFAVVLWKTASFICCRVSKLAPASCFFFTLQIWADSLLIKEPIRLQNSSYLVSVYLIIKYICFDQDKLFFSFIWVWQFLLIAVTPSIILCKTINLNTSDLLFMHLYISYPGLKWQFEECGAHAGMKSQI